MKQYARISTYGSILVPLNMLEKFVEQAYLANFEYIDNEPVLTEVHNIKEFKLHSEKEVREAQAQMILEGKK